MPGIQISDALISFLIFLPMFFLSLTVHEYAHAITAFKYGDTTAKDQGRLTLNPVKHIDLVGSILMPFFSFASGFLLIGWAKPIPVNRANFSNPRKDDLLVTFAGPFSNFLLAFLFLICFIFVINFFPENSAAAGVLIKFFWYGVFFNIFLSLFNLLPIPPLDGSHILYNLFPNRLTAGLLNLGLYGSILLILFIYSPLWGFFMNLVNFMVNLFFSVAGMKSA